MYTQFSTSYHKGSINKDDFISFLTIKKQLSKNTVRHTLQSYRVFSKWLWSTKRKLNQETVEQFFLYLMDERKIKPNSMNTYYFFLSQLNEYCKDRKIEKRFFEGFKSFPKTRPHIEILTPDEIERLISAERKYANRNKVNNKQLGFIYSTLIMFIAYTGCRLNEATSLKIENIDLTLGRAIFIETKNKHTREVFFTEPLLSRIEKLIGERDHSDLVFLSTTGKKIIPQAFERDLKLRAKMIGLKKRIYPHLFRHSFATQLLMSGVDITVVASILGHLDIQTTYGNYVHLADKTRRLGMFKHPLIRKGIDPTEIIKGIKETLEGFNLENDIRFNYTFKEMNGGIYFSVQPSVLT